MFFVTQSQRKTLNVVITFALIIANPVVGLVLAISIVPTLLPKEQVMLATATPLVFMRFYLQQVKPASYFYERLIQPKV